MKAGNLVKNRCATIHLPKGTIGLIIGKTRNNFNDFDLYKVKFFGNVHNISTRLYGIRDLELVS
jgi:hypothetical protein